MYNIGELIQDRFEIKTVLCGGMGMIYVCLDTLQKKFVALKTLQDQFLTTISSAARFSREAQTWITLGRHPHIVHAYKVEQIHGLPYIFMDYVPGQSPFGSSLRGWILHGGVGLTFAIDITLQICDGLLYAQRKLPGLVHRDLKPENILITHSKLVKITDFGLVAAISDEPDWLDLSPDAPQELFEPTLTKLENIVGTPPYMSPEQCIGDQIDHRSDIYSLGCILYELLTGLWLFDSRSPREWLRWHIYQTPIPPSTLNNRAGPFDYIVLRCLEKQPTKRYQTFDGLATDLEEAYRQLTGVTYIRHRQDESTSTTYDYGMDRARSFFILGNQDMALSELEDILLVNPTSADAWQLKGSVLAQQERPHDALTCFEKVLEISPSTSAQISKGMAYLMLGRVDDAITILKAFVDDASRDKAHAALVNLGIAYQMKGKNAEALQCFNEAIRNDPWSRSAWVNKAYTLRMEGRPDEAMLCLKQAFIYSISFKDRIELIFDLGEADELMCDMALHALTRIPPQILLRRGKGLGVLVAMISPLSSVAYKCI